MALAFWHWKVWSMRKGSADGRVYSPDAQPASLGPHITEVDEAMEETLGDTEDGQEDNGMEQVMLVKYIVWEAWMN